VRWRPVVLAYLLLAGLAAEYWLVERPRARPEREAAPEPARPRFLPVLSPADVREVRLTRDGRTVVSRREADAWTVVEPVGTAIPSDLIGAFATALAQAEEIARVGHAEGDAFGLREGATRVELRAATGAPVVVTIGAANPTGTAVYAQRADSAEVVLIGRQVRYYEDLIFQALTSERAPATETGAPIGG
jgi:hypothetical protein